MLTHENYISTLLDAKLSGEHLTYLETLSNEERIDVFKQFFLELNEHSKNYPDNWVIDAVRTRILTILLFRHGAKEGLLALELLSGSMPVKGTGKGKKDKPLFTLSEAVSRFAFAHQGDEIEQLLEETKDVETLALLLHEALLREKLSSGSALTKKLAARIKEAKHPLAPLPHTLSELETGMFMTEYKGYGTSTLHSPFCNYEGWEKANIPKESKNTEAEIQASDRKNLMASAVGCWLSGRKVQKFEGRFFQQTLKSEQCFGSILSSLPLECLAGSKSIHFRDNVAAAEIFHMLFSAALSGAREDGEPPAYARLSAWKSLTGLIGGAIDEPFSTLAERAGECRWCLFEGPAGKKWFKDWGYNLGIGCYHAQSAVLAVMAATDWDTF